MSLPYLAIDFLTEPYSRETVGEYLSYLSEGELTEVQLTVQDARSMLDHLHQAVVVERLKRSPPNQVSYNEQP